MMSIKNLHNILKRKGVISLSCPAILLLCTAKEFGGAENHSLLLFKHLQSSNIPAKMVVLKNSTLAKKIVQLPKTLQEKIVFIQQRDVSKFNWFSTAASRLATLCTRQNIHIIQCNTEKEVLFANKIVKKKRGKTKPSILLTRHVLTDCKKKTLQMLDTVIAVSTPIQHLMEKSKKSVRSTAPVVYIPPMYDAKQFLHPAIPQQTRKDFFKHLCNKIIEDHEPVICMIANLYKTKNHHLLLTAISKINNKHVHVILAGKGPLLKSLSALCHHLQIADRVHFIGFTNQVKEILYHVDINILPSKQEGLGLAVLEAALMKKASITASGNGSSDIIKHLRTGFVFKNGNVQDCINKITFALDHPELTKQLGHAAYNFVKDNFAPQKILQDYLHLYRSQK